MTNKTIPELPAASALAAGNQLHIVDADGNSRSVTLAQLKTFFNTDPTVIPAAAPFRGARVRKNASQNVASAVVTALTWQVADRDTDGIFSAGAPTRLTVPSGVTKVRIGGAARFSATHSGLNQLTMYRNGAWFHGAAALTLGGGSQDMTFWSDVIDVTPGQFFEMIFWHNRGVDLAVDSFQWSWFAMNVVEASP